MDWKDLAPFLVVLGVLGGMWWQLNSRIDLLDAKIGGVNSVLTTNLIALNRDIGELRGQAHTHIPPQEAR